MKIAFAQLNFTVGDIPQNIRKIINAANQAKCEQADIILFSELCVTGYPAEDLLLRPDFIQNAELGISTILHEVKDILVIIGYPALLEQKLYNTAIAILNGDILATYHKMALPNYGVFDEQRYFTAGNTNTLFNYKSHRFALTICEDVWQTGIIKQNQILGADIILSLNASPFQMGKIAQRESVICKQIKESGIPLVYANQIGGQDELIFDGASFVVHGDGEIAFRAAEFVEQISIIEFIDKQPVKAQLKPIYEAVIGVYHALVLGIKDYVHKNGFKGAILGLSGGIDSALVLALAVDALGAEHVEAVLMPSRYTHEMSIADAKTEADILGVRYHIISIEPAVQAFNDLLQPVFTGSQIDSTEENIQARCRGVILMAISNKHGKLLLTTGNKSEMSVGYATLYGDMAGGFAPIKDVYKLLVYRLAEYRNSLSPVIPLRVITRPPSAELAPNQKDEDSLPAYSVLDPILELYIEQDYAVADILALGFTEADVSRATSLVDRNEYKRRQSPPGIRITNRAFGRDRRYPISSSFRGNKLYVETSDEY